MCYAWFSLSVSTWQSYSRAEQLCLYHPPQHLAQEREMPTAGNWKDGSALKNAWCVCRVPGFGSQHSNPTAHNHLQLQSHETWHLFTHMVYRQAGTHTHMHKINKSFFKKKKKRHWCNQKPCSVPAFSLQDSLSQRRKHIASMASVVFISVFWDPSNKQIKTYFWKIEFFHWTETVWI